MKFLTFIGNQLTTLEKFDAYKAYWWAWGEVWAREVSARYANPQGDLLLNTLKMSSGGLVPKDSILVFTDMPTDVYRDLALKTGDLHFYKKRAQQPPPTTIPQENQVPASMLFAKVDDNGSWDLKSAAQHAEIIQTNTNLFHVKQTFTGSCCKARR